MTLSYPDRRRILFFIIPISFFLFINYSQAQTQGPSSGNTFQNTAVGGGVSWSNLNNAATLDGDNATAGPTDEDDKKTDYLVVTNFNFSIPEDNIINGIEITVYKNSDNPSKNKDNIVKLVKGGVITGANRKLNTVWQDQGVPAWITYGGSSDLWGESWSYSDINSSDFGVAFSAKQKGSGTTTPAIDNMRIKVHYSSPLPIELLSFTATLPDNKRVQLKWTTASEINNNYFTIERSKNGATFEEIAKANGAGNSTAILNYTAYDNAPVEGNSYYRLKQTDYDGKYEYSDLITVYYDKKSGGGCILKVYPNPCIGQCNVEFADCNEEDAEINVEIIDALGNKVYSKVPYRNEKGSFSFSIDTKNNLKPGIYVVRGISKKEKYDQKVIIK